MKLSPPNHLQSYAAARRLYRDVRFSLPKSVQYVSVPLAHGWKGGPKHVLRNYDRVGRESAGPSINNAADPSIKGGSPAVGTTVPGGQWSAHLGLGKICLAEF